MKLEKNGKFSDIGNCSTSCSPLQGKYFAELEEIVRQAYRVFSHYSINLPLDICTQECCLPADAELKLANQSLKTINSDLLQSWNHAAKTASPNLNEFKYFLPRILELISKYDFPAHSIELSLKSFQSYSESDWLIEERKVLAKFMDVFFLQSLNVFPLPHYAKLEEILVMIDKAGFDIASYIALWEKSKCNEAVFHFSALADFEVQFGNEEAYSNNFASKEFVLLFSNWLNSNAVQLEFVQKIESLILSDQTFDEVTMESLNRAFEILELNGLNC